LIPGPADNGTHAFDATGRRDADMRIELSEESLRLAAEAAEVGTWDLDLTTGVLTWSDRTKAMFGISRDASVSMRDFYAGLHPEDLAATAAAFASAVDPAVRATYDVEYRTVGREDGVTRWVAAKGKGLFTGGICRRAIGTAIDITARRRAAMCQAFVLDLMDRLRRLTCPDDILATAVRALGDQLGASRVGYGQIQPDDETVVLATCHASGVDALSGAFPLDAFGAHHIDTQRGGVTVAVDDVAADPRNDLATWTAIEARAFVSVPLVREGRLRATLFVNQRDPRAWAGDEIGLIEDVAGRIWDALERARAEEALRELNASLERQVEARTHERDRIWRVAPVLMVVGDQHGTLLEANPAWTRVLGWSQEETVGRNVMTFVAEEDRAAGAAGMARLFAGKAVVEYQLTFLARTGDRRRIAWTTVPEGDRLYGHGRDVTDQVVAEDRLRQSQKMEAVGQLTGGLAHDFNNLLTGITGALELIRKRLEQGRTADLERYMDAAQDAARRAGALTQRLLAYARQQTLDPRPTDMNQLVAGMEALVRQAVGPACDIRVQAAPGLWTTLVDPHQLENALLNLCINARDAMPDGGVLRIQTANRSLGDAAARGYDLPAGDYVALSVTDTGTGMAPETVRRAFDPFFTTKPLGTGTGLGLSMIYGFARQSGGQVRIESELGRGTCVSVVLPRHMGEAEAPDTGCVPAAERGASQGETVLVVDDEAAVRMLVTELLDDLGYTTLEAVDGAAGLNVLRSDTPVDLLVTDVGLPGGITGRQLADAARALRPGLRVLFITGYAETAVLSDARVPGVRVLTKPFPLDVLAAHIRELVAESAVL
jgi:PAS domain S-box-containing protein